MLAENLFVIRPFRMVMFSTVKREKKTLKQQRNAFIHETKTEQIFPFNSSIELMCRAVD